MPSLSGIGSRPSVSCALVDDMCSCLVHAAGVACSSRGRSADGILLWEHDRGSRVLRAHCATRSFDLNREKNGPLL